jgi:sulfite exporter TauE/SafE/copper chaperone CopZ
MNSIMLFYRVANLNKDTSAKFEEVLRAVKGVNNIETWNGRAEIHADSKEYITDIHRVAKDNGFNLEPLSAKVIAHIEGMTCGSCEMLLEQRLEKITTIERATLNAEKGIATLQVMGIAPSAQELQDAIGLEKYKVTKITHSNEQSLTSTSPQPWFRALGLIALILLVKTMLNGFDISSLTSLTTHQATTFVAAVILGLVAGSSSCIAVSGGLMLSSLAVLKEKFAHEKKWQTRTLPIFSFILGRLLSYAGLGALIGLLGEALTPSSSVTGFLTLIAALTMIIAGMDMLGIAPLWMKRITPKMPKVLGKWLTKNATTAGVIAPFLLGIVTFFLPCGFTQSLQIYALTTGSALQSGAILLGFAVGTIPALLALGIASTSLKGKWATWFMQCAGAVVLLLGITNIQSAMTLIGHPLQLPSITIAKSAANSNDLPPIINGKQIISMSVGEGTKAYTPDFFTVRQGVPVEWKVEGKNLSGCVSILQSDQLGIYKPLAIGENIIDFTPDKAGTFTFSCSMGMYRGTMKVISADTRS